MRKKKERKQKHVPAGTGVKSKKTDQKPAQQQEKRMPVYLIALIAVAALLLGYFLSTLFNPEPVVDINKLRQKEEKEFSVNAILVFDDNCRVCERNHSFLQVLNENNIGVLLAEVPLSTNDGKRIVIDFNISQLPVLMIVKSTVDEKIIVNSTSGQKPLQEVLAALAEEKLEYYVLEEQGFDGKAHTTRLLDTSCKQPDWVTVDLFEDPYSPNTIKFKQETIDERKRFDKNIAFNYNLLATTTAQFPPILKENAEYFERTLLCAIDLGVSNDFEKNFYLEYCGISDKNSLDAADYANCGSGRTARTPLSKEKVDELVEKTGVKEFFDICLSQKAPDFIRNSATKASLFYVTSTPTAIVDCKYKTHPRFLPSVICFSKPDLPGCKTQ